MRAACIGAFGEAGALRLEERPAPRPGAGQVLIKVAASGVNRADVLQRRGLYPPPSGTSDIPGLEVAGDIVALGEGVSAWSVGERVCALLAGGGYAELAVAEAAECLPAPPGVGMEEAAGLPETLLTVWSNVIDRARLRPGESVLVHGGAGGIGTTAIQLLKLYGARVFATAGSAEKAAFCRHLGAAAAVNYREQDFVAALKAETGGHGVDVILDMVGGDYIQRNMELAAAEGRIVHIACQAGFQADVNFLPLLRKRLSLLGSTLRAREAAFKAALTAEVRRHAWPWVESGALRAVVHQVFPAARAADAHRMMEAGAHIGKLNLRW